MSFWRAATCLTLGLGSLGFLGTAEPAPAEQPDPPAAGVRTWTDEGARQTEAVLPGPIEDFLLAAGPGGRQRLLLLVTPAEAETDTGDGDGDGEDESDGAEAARLLFELELGGEGRLRQLAGNLPPGIDRLDQLQSPEEGRARILLGDGEEYWLLEENHLGRGSLAGNPADGDPSGGDPAGGNPADGDPAGGDPTDEDPVNGDPSDGDPADGNPAGGSPVDGDLAGRIPGSSVSSVPALKGGSRVSSAISSAPVQHPELARILPGQLLRLRLAGGELSEAPALDLPVRARRQRHSLLLQSPPVSQLPRAGLAPLYAVGPEAYGDRRLRTVLVDGETGEREEGWALLPAPEEVEKSWYGFKDGRPVLVTAVFSADKLGIFERHRLRVFLLGKDRTRGGRRPILEATTASRRWQQVEPFITDADGDGRDDLVVFQTEGMGAGKLLFEAFLGAPGDGFSLKSRKTVLDFQPGRWHYGGDVTGDGAADVVATDDGRLLVFAGTPGSRRHLVERKPSLAWTIDGPQDDDSGRQDVNVNIEVGDEGTSAEMLRPGRWNRLRVADLDGDGKSEILLLRFKHQGRGLVRVLRPKGP